MNQYYETPNQEVVGLKKDRSGVLSFAKIFFYMFIGLAITTAVAFGIGGIFTLAKIRGADDTMLNNAYLGLMIGSGITLIIMTFVINLVFLRGRHSILVPALIYSILMGVLLSSFTIWVDWRLLGAAFGITSGIFLIMTLIASLTKGNMSPLLMLGIGLLMGSGLLVLINLLIGSTTLYWAISFAIFAAMMFITMFDIWNIKKICENGAMSRNLELYCAFNLYVDFVYILIRIIYFLILIYGRSK